MAPEKPGLLDAEGRLRDLSGVVSDIHGSVLERFLPRLARLAPGGCPWYRADLGWGRARVGWVSSSASTSTTKTRLSRPVLLTPKAGGFPQGHRCHPWPLRPHRDFPGLSKDRLGRGGHRAHRPLRFRGQALEYVAATVRSTAFPSGLFRLERGGQWAWDKGKGCDRFGPVDPIW